MGNLEPNDADKGNMKKIKFYVCPTCGNILTATGEGEVFCCGRKLAELVPKIEDETHRLNVEQIEDDFYITFDHEMSKTHFISFVACAAHDRMLLVKLYPEQAAEVRFPVMRKGQIYFYCNQHGLWVKE